MWQILGSLCDFACILLLEHAHSGNRVRGQLLREPLVHLALINLEREIPHEDGRTRGVDSLRRGEQTEERCLVLVVRIRRRIGVVHARCENGWECHMCLKNRQK